MEQTYPAVTGGAAIACTGLRKDYGSFVLDGLDLTIPEGTICGLVGENGAGKTTTIRLLMGALRPDGGTARVLGVDPRSPAFRRTKEDIGVVLDEASFPEILTARQIGRVLAGLYRNWDAEAWTGWLDRFQLPPGQLFKAYSRGMRMKLSIAAALSHNARLLVLDEPTSGLDPIVRDQVVEVFRDFAAQEDHSILMSSHILSDLEKLCDSIAFLHQGKLLFCQDKDTLLEEYGLLNCTAEQADSLFPEAVAGREDREYGGVRLLVRRNLVPDGLVRELDRPTVEDVILFTVRGAKAADRSRKGAGTAAYQSRKGDGPHSLETHSETRKGDGPQNPESHGGTRKGDGPQSPESHSGTRKGDGPQSPISHSGTRKGRDGDGPVKSNQERDTPRHRNENKGASEK